MGTPTAPPGSPGTAKSITYSTPTSSSTTSSTTNPSSLPSFTGFPIPTILYSLDGINYTTPLKGDPLIEHILSDGTVASVEYPFITINGTQVPMRAARNFPSARLSFLRRFVSFQGLDRLRAVGMGVTANVVVVMGAGFWIWSV